MTEKKRCRSANYNSTEKDFIVDLIIKYIDVIEDKRTDGNLIKKKESTWKKIEEEFNGHSNVSKRSVKQLKIFYDNYKRKIKKDQADDSVSGYSTSTFQPKSDGTSNKLWSMLKDKSEPLGDHKDSDSAYLDSNCSNGSNPERDDVSENEDIKEEPQYLNGSISQGKVFDNCGGKSSGSMELQLLQMTREEHEAKMKILHLKKRYLETKISLMENGHAKLSFFPNSQ